MMPQLSGMERTVSQWKELLHSVGLEIVKFWEPGKEVDGLIEAVLNRRASKRVLELGDNFAGKIKSVNGIQLIDVNISQYTAFNRTGCHTSPCSAIKRIT